MSMRHHLRAIAYGCLLAFTFVPRPATADTVYETVTKGNALYRQQHYREAAQQYAKAAEQRPETPEIEFNLGNAAYKQQDYAKALDHYNRALQTTDPVLQGQTKYNLGNVNYQQALQTLANPQQAIEHLQTAMTYYRDSLDAPPQPPAARYNLELANRLLQQLQQQQQQNQEQSQREQKKSQDQQQKDKQDQQQNQQGQDDQQQAQKDQQEKDPDQKDESRQQDQTQQASSQDQKNQSTPENDENSSNDPETPPQATASQELTPDEAERLLNAIRDRAREADDLRQQRQRARLRDNRVDRDW